MHRIIDMYDCTYMLAYCENYLTSNSFEIQRTGVRSSYLANFTFNVQTEAEPIRSCKYSNGFQLTLIMCSDDGCSGFMCFVVMIYI